MITSRREEDKTRANGRTNTVHWDIDVKGFRGMQRMRISYALLKWNQFIKFLLVGRSNLEIMLSRPYINTNIRVEPWKFFSRFDLKILGWYGVFSNRNVLYLNKKKTHFLAKGKGKIVKSHMQYKIYEHEKT